MICHKIRWSGGAIQIHQNDNVVKLPEHGYGYALRISQDQQWNHMVIRPTWIIIRLMSWRHFHSLLTSLNTEISFEIKNIQCLTCTSVTHTSVVSPTVFRCQNLCYLNSVQPSWCRMDTARSYSHFSVIQLEAHISLLNFVRERCPLHMSQRTLPGETTCISTFGHTDQSEISREEN